MPIEELHEIQERVTDHFTYATEAPPIEDDEEFMHQMDAWEGEAERDSYEDHQGIVSDTPTSWGREPDPDDPFAGIVMICPATEICKRRCNHKTTHKHGHIYRSSTFCTKASCDSFYTYDYNYANRLHCIPYKTYINIKTYLTERSWVMIYTSAGNQHQFNRIIADFIIMLGGQEKYYEWLKQ